MTDIRPVRLRLSRANGFSLQAISLATNGLPAMKVDRSTGFGNPFPITKGTSTSCGVTTDVWHVGTWEGPAMWFRDSEAEARKFSVDAFAGWVALPAQSALRDRAQIALRGHNPACWCALPNPGKPDICHGAIWLKLVCEAA